MALKHNPSGVYIITNQVSGNIYVGSSRKMRSRFYDHRKALKAGTHHTIALQRAWNKYGPDVFTFEFALFCSAENCLFYEQTLMDNLQPKYNSARVAGSSLGIKRTPEQKARVKAAAIVRSADPAFRARLSELHKERWRQGLSGCPQLLDPATKAKSLEARRTPEVRAVLTKKARARAKKYEIRGELLSVLEACEKYGKDYRLTRQRLKYMSIEDALFRDLKSNAPANVVLYEHEGQKLNLRELAEVFGVSKTTIFRRIKAGKNYDGSN